MKSILLPTLLLLLTAAAPLTAQQATSPWPGSPANHAQPASHTDSVLQAKLQTIVHGFGGDAGVYVRHLVTGASVAISADDVFPAASMVKVPIMFGVYDQVERGVLDLDARLPYPDTLRYAYVESTDVVGYMAPGDTLPLSQLVFLMLSVSDNVASLWLQALVGGGVRVNEWLAANGFEQTRVNSRTPDRAAEQREFGWGQTTPREIARTLVMVREGSAVSAPASERMYRMLTNTYWKDEAISQIPPHVQVASKQGAVSRSRSEVLLVNAPTGAYVLSVITRNQQDTSYEPDNEGFRLIRSISRAVYQHFNPADPWRPLD
jgi:beta-lactamase class A